MFANSRMKNRLLIMSTLLALASFAVDLHVIPNKQDPPIMVDGILDDWNDVHTEIRLGKDDFLDALNGKGKWGGENDFSGSFKFCWKPGGLYVGVKVTDDIFLQNDKDELAFYGDHVELFIDVTPSVKADGNDFGKGQFQLLLSPGNFDNLKPQVFCVFPDSVPLKDALCASTRLEDGWSLEAFLPWDSLAKGSTIKQDDIFAMHAWISDADLDKGDHPQQKQILTTGKKNAVFRKRADLTPAVFADAEGHHNAKLELQSALKLDFSTPLSPAMKDKQTFTIGKYPKYLSPVLHLSANLTTSSMFGGYARVMHILVNGKQLNGRALLKPHDEFFTVDGQQSFVFQDGKGFLVPYTKDWKAGNNPEITKRFISAHYNMHEFAIDLSNFLQEGENTIEIINELGTKYNSQLCLKDVSISFEALQGRRASSEAPTGELPQIVPMAPLDMAGVSAQATPSRLTLKMPDGREFTVTSKYSTPDGGWAEDSCSFFDIDRKVEKLAEGFLVRDTFTNKLDEHLPLMQFHQLSGKNAEFHIGGIKGKPSSNLSDITGNTSVFAGSDGGGIGIFAQNVEFQEHCCGRVISEDSIEIGDKSMALPPKGSITQEFIVVPVAKGGYYEFVNAVRRQIGANVKLEGPIGTWAAYKNWMSRFYDRINTLGIHFMLCDLPNIGLEFHTNPKRNDVKSMITQIRTVRPSIKIYRYFHSQIECNPDVEFKSGRLLYKNGSQAHYGEKALLYLNLEETAYSRMMESVIDDMLDNWDIDGIYWDEFHNSGPSFHYGDPWDGCSADIDMKTHKIDTLKSSVFLIQRPWKNRMVDKILARGKRIYANGNSARRGEFAQKVDFTFSETQLKTNNARMHFTTPLAHENCDGIKSLQDYYFKMLDSLDYGVLANFSFISVPDSGQIWPTIAEQMYPTTPLELHAGYVIGEERIVSKVSGCFGWNDASKHQVFVFNSQGQRVENHGMKTLSIDGKTFTELRLPGDWSAVIVRILNSD